MYVPLHQSNFGYMRLFVRSASDPSLLIPAIREIVWAIDPTVPLPSFQMMEEVVGESVAQEAFLSRLVTLFAALGLVLAVVGVGVYGVVSFAVGQREREIGIRRALGASAGEVTRLLVSWTLRRVAAGVALGMLAATVLDGLARDVLFGVSASTPWVLASVSMVMMAAELLAAYRPTRRALEVDPVTTLRAES